MKVWRLIAPFNTSVPAGTADGGRIAHRPHLIAVNRFYWPDHSATGQLLTDLCEHAAASGFQVTVIASRMRYDAARERLPGREVRNGVRIRRVRSTRLGRSWTLGRLIDYLSYSVVAFLTLLALARRGDVILAKTDPPLISVPAGIAARLRGARLVNWLQDMFPEIAGALGMTWASGPAGRLLQRLRDRSLKAAHTNIVICDRMAERVRRGRCGSDHLRVIHNWPSASIRPVPRDQNRLRADWGLADRFIVGYSGNLGRPHAAHAIAELLRRTACIEGIAWLFVGGGSGRVTVQVAAAAAGLPVYFQDYQPRERLAESLSVPDLHLVSLDATCEGLLMPSKFYGVMAAGRPVLSLGDPDGAVAREVRRGSFGIALDIAAPDTWQPELAAISTPEATAIMGARAREWFETQYLTAPPLEAWLTALRHTAEEERPLPTAAAAAS